MDIGPGRDLRRSVFLSSQYGWWDPLEGEAMYRDPQEQRYNMLHLERLPLHTPYPLVVVMGRDV